jgi:hypothetical protein
MACCKLSFNKNNDPFGSSPDISIPDDPGFLQDGMQTPISVCLRNTSDFQCVGNVAIYWAPLDNQGNIGLPTLISFLGNLNLIANQTVPAGGNCTFPFPWTPLGVQSSVSDPNELCIFVQAIVVPVLVGPDSCPGKWRQSDFDKSKPYNAAQVFPFAVSQ